MKTKFKLFVLLLMVFSFGCKEDKNTKNKSAVSVIEKITQKELVNEQVYIDEFLDNFIVEINAIVEKDDYFHVFYLTNQFEDYFLGQQSVGTNIKGKPIPQDIKIVLPKDTIPTRLRLDFGMNKEQELIKINSIKLSFEDRQLILVDSIFTKYFQVNEYIKLLEDNKYFRLEMKNEGKYDPYVIGSVLLNKKLENLLQQQFF